MLLGSAVGSVRRVFLVDHPSPPEPGAFDAASDAEDEDALAAKAPRFSGLGDGESDIIDRHRWVHMTHATMPPRVQVGQ